MNVTIKGHKQPRRRSLRCSRAARSISVVVALWCGVVAIVVTTVFSRRSRRRWANLRSAAADSGSRGEFETAKKDPQPAVAAKAASARVGAPSSSASSAPVGVPPLDPNGAVIGDAEVFWLLPSGPGSDRGGIAEAGGILVHFHGCNHGGADFFRLPEDRIVAQEALSRGLAVLSVTSQDRESGCWGPDDAAVMREQETVARWAERVGLRGDLPVVGLGASSGAAFLFDAWKIVGFKAMASYIIARGFEQEDIDRGHSEHNKEISLPPTAFVHMPRDDFTAFAVRSNSEALESAGRTTLVIEVNAHAFTADKCSERLPELGRSRCADLIGKLKEYPHLYDSSSHMVRRNTWGEDNAWDEVFEGAGLDSDLKDRTQKDSKELRGQVPSNSFKGHSWLWAAVDEEINAAFGVHEMVAERSQEILDWLLQQAGLT